MKMLRSSITFLLIGIACFIAGSHLERAAQAAGIGCPTFTYGLVPSPGQWQACFDAKQAALGYTPVNKAGDTMSGKLIAVTGTTGSASMNVPQGAAPSSPINGDIWTTTAGLFVRTNGISNGPITGIPAYNNAGTLQTLQHIVYGSQALTAGTATITLSGSAVFTSNATYQCWVGDKSGTAAATSVTLTNGTSFAVKGSTTNTVAYICIGN